MFDKESTKVKSMFSSIASSYDLTNHIISFGMHNLWKRKLVSLAPEDNDIKALDLCTGTGDLLPLLGRKYSDVTGADFCPSMLKIARDKFSDEYNLIEADALDLPFEDNSYDLITIAYGIRNFENLDRGLKEVSRVLKNGGTLLILESGQPDNFIISKFFNFYSKHILPLIGLIFAKNKSAYTYLPETASSFPYGKDLNTILEKNEFIPEKARSLSFGVSYIYKSKLKIA
ncbi:UNVERIFIED_CONTAM: hypothetical protein GTU68_008759 [Idotea baltica]|nr:hypothetical protein [Idotea baltica]